MPETTLLARGALTIVEYRCRSGALEPAFPEVHACPSVSYVRSGSFGYHARGRSFELVAGSVLVGSAGDEFVCTHDHHRGGDECLCFQLTPELLDSLGCAPERWQAGALPPLAELMVLGERAQACASGASSVGLDEAGLALVARLLELGPNAGPGALDARPLLRRRVIESALWMDESSAEPIGLERAAAFAGLSAYHYLRLFRRVLGLTPHQYLIRCRLRRAARLLSEGAPSVTQVAHEVGFGDLSNFVRTFRRAAGVTPRAFRVAALAKASAHGRRGPSRQRPGDSSRQRRGARPSASAAQHAGGPRLAP